MYHRLWLRIIKVVVYNSNTDEVIISQTQDINLKKYKGKIYVESPTMSTFNKEINLSGWEMSESDESYVKLYIDNKLLDVDFDRTPRGDVVGAIVGYGTPDNNKTPGFSKKININNVGNGNHVITLKLFSKYNDVLDSYSKKVFIYKKVHMGVDLSYWNASKNTNQDTGGIDFAAVKNDGIDFAMIRLGYRGYGSGKLATDEKFSQFSKGVLDNNIKLGIYFFSQAIDEKEGLEEANYVIDVLKNTYYINEKNSKVSYASRVSYPIAFDTERVEGAIGRADYISVQKRTDAAKAFCKRIKEAGYTPIIYASKSFLYNDLYMSQLQDYDVWVAHYNKTDNPINNPTDYTGAYQMWQYTSTGKVSGVSGNGGKVDLDISYYNY